MEAKRRAATSLIFINEAWAMTNMTRTHGRALRRQRLVVAVPNGIEQS
jgi:hypothetical protein